MSDLQQPRHTSTLPLVALVYSEGWTWPLKAAAVMIPISLLIG